MRTSIIRYGLSPALLVTMPGALLYWFSIHGLVGFWRRLGLTTTAVVHFLVLLAVAALVLQWRATLLAVEFGNLGARI